MFFGISVPPTSVNVGAPGVGHFSTALVLFLVASVQGVDDDKASLASFANDFLAVPPDILDICRALFENTEEFLKSKNVDASFGKSLNDLDIEGSVDLLKRNRPPWMQTYKDCKEKLDVVAVRKNLECIWREGNITSLNEEVNLAVLESRGGLNSVFRDFCLKIPRMFGCVDELLEIVESSQSLEEQRFSAALRNQLDSVQHYFCDEDGAKIALFFGAGGMECVEEASEEIQSCSRLKFNNLEDIFGMKGLHNVETFEKRIQDLCRDLEVSQHCYVRILRQRCSSKIVANLIEGLFASVLQKEPCSSVPRLTSPNSAAVVPSNQIWIAVVLLASFLSL